VLDDGVRYCIVGVGVGVGGAWTGVGGAMAVVHDVADQRLLACWSATDCPCDPIC